MSVAVLWSFAKKAALVDAAATTPHHMERGDSLGDSLGIPGGLARIFGGLALKRGCFLWVLGGLAPDHAGLL